MFLIIGLYVVGAIIGIYYLRQRQTHELMESRVSNSLVAITAVFAFVARMLISWFIEGQARDVRCFQIWGHIMSAVGPGWFYKTSVFCRVHCDYPPLYMYVLSVNSVLSDLLGGSDQVMRMTFRFVPCLCDVIGCLVLYKVCCAVKFPSDRCFLLLVLMAFHPVMILNSAGWGQIDSVLAILILCVAICALYSKWRIALPLYVVAVLTKPQALLLGPLGFIFMIITWLRNKSSRKDIIVGLFMSVLVFFASIIPFSIRQNWDWIIKLYTKTLESYPYVTINAANIYYLFGGNWVDIGQSASVFAGILFGILCIAYDISWLIHAHDQKHYMIEGIGIGLFGVCFIMLGILHVSWSLIGSMAMVFIFGIILSTAIRSTNIQLLPWLGGLLFVLLYVFGVKMHERYILPAFFLLFYAWIVQKDRRILYLLLLFTATSFINEWIVLDNSIRLGVTLGHLNEDTVWIADIISILNVIGTIWAGCLNIQYCTVRNKAHVCVI